FSFTAKVTDAAAQTATAPLQISIAPAPLLITTTSPLTSGQATVAYSATLAATGGTTPYTWSVTAGALPGGLTLSSAGLLSGTPTTAGTFSFTAKVTDAAARTSTAPLQITITPAPLVISTTSPLTSGQAAVAYSATLGATGGTTPYTWSVSAGALPGGLTLSSAGLLSGTPTTAGTFSFTAKVTDAAARTATAPLQITIAPAPLVISTTSPLTSGQATVAYSATLAATGGTTPYTWSVSAGALPGGLTLSSAGLLSGTPTTAGTFSFTAKVTDAAAQTATAPLQISIAPAPLLITTTSPLTSGQATVAYSATLAATGGTTPYTWSVTGGALPGGLTLSSAGLLSGTPTTAGTFSFTAKVTDAAAQTATAPLQITIAPAPLVISTTSPLTSGQATLAYSATLAATGGTTPYTWSVSAGALPGGLTLSSAGLLSGTPTTAGTFSFTAKVTDAAAQTATAPLQITIAPAPLLITTTSPLTSGQATRPHAQLNFSCEPLPQERNLIALRNATRTIIH